MYMSRSKSRKNEFEESYRALYETLSIHRIMIFLSFETNQVI